MSQLFSLEIVSTLQQLDPITKSMETILINVKGIDKDSTVLGKFTGYFDHEVLLKVFEGIAKAHEFDYSEFEQLCVPYLKDITTDQNLVQHINDHQKIAMKSMSCF